ncbi:MAG: universal stress protein, partial [Flavitalea sp.]
KFIKPVSDGYEGIEIKIELIKGDPVHAICRFCIDKQIDLLVMGTKGASGIREVLIGSVTANCITRTHVPVLAIPDRYILEEPDAILFVTNHFERNTTLLNKMVEIASLFTASIHVAIFEDNDLVQSRIHNENIDELNSYLEFLRQKFPSVVFKGEVLTGTSFEGAVERYEIKNMVDIVAMIAYPKDFLERTLGRSATKKMAFHSRIPVLSIQIDPSEL